MKTDIPMDDEGFAHMCKLSLLCIAMIQEPDFRPKQAVYEIGDQNFGNMLSILAKTTRELMRRDKIKPKIRVLAKMEDA